jgi:hypothetical protein
LCENLSSWQNALGIAFDQGGFALPRPGEVPSQHVTELQYEHDGLLWRSDWRVLAPRKVVDKSLTVEHRLVIHLPNDGFFYADDPDKLRFVNPSSVVQKHAITLS